MSNILKGIQLNEADPRNFDSDVDYYAARNAPSKPRYRGTQSPGVNPDDEDYFREIFRKKREAAKKAEQDKQQGVAEGSLEEVDRRGFLKGLGAAAVAAAAGGAIDAKAQSRAKIAVEVGELDTGTKEYEPVNSGQSRNFIYLYDSSEFIMQWIDRRGNNIGEPEVFQAKGSGTDFKNRPNTLYFGSKNAVKVVPNGAPEGDLIYFTPRNWIDQKIGWRSVYYQMFSKVKESVEQGVVEGLNEFAVDPANGGDDDEYDLLFKLVKMWWLGNEQQHFKAEKTLASMGISIEENDPDIILHRGKQFLKFPMDDFQQDMTEEQIDELKCWPGHHRVKGTKAGFPGSCAKNKTNEEQELEEKWSQKYKDSINCSNPKGFSQKAHCASKNEDITEEKCPECGGPMFSEMIMNEKKDACYYKVKSRYKVWPSAYASGALVKCRKKGASNWGTGGKSNESVEDLDENLHKWFKEKWVRFGPDGKIRGDCARGDDSEGKPKCLPQSKAHSLGKKGRASAASRKRREDPNPERSGKAINVNTKKKSNEGINEGLDYNMRQQLIRFLAKKMDWEVSYLELASDANLISWYKKVQAGKDPMKESQKEADYGDDYQSMVSRVGQKAKAQDAKKSPEQKQADLERLAKRLNQPEKKSNILKGIEENLGTPYPSTYEEENKPFMKKGSYRITAMTSENKK